MKLILRYILACIVPLIFVSGALAQASRTWVSGVGDDANPCSRTAPCKTFAGAISKTAAGGIISVLDPAGYGAVTITKAITLDGGGNEGSILVSGTAGVTVITAATDQVTLRNLTIYGIGTGTDGIRVLKASGRVIVQSVTISGFNIGINFNTTGRLQVQDSYIHSNRTHGVYFRNGRGSFDNVRFENNETDGLRVGTGGVVGVRRSVFAGHLNNIGASATEAPSAKLMLDDCLVDNNATGIGAAGGGTVSVSATTISNNAQGVWQDGSSFLITFGNNRLANNGTTSAFTSSVALQ